jgi:hypothetical protein
VIGGAISPGGDSAGSLTNTGGMIFSAGGSLVWDMNNALGQPGTNWDYLAIGGGLTIQSVDTNPFVIRLRSIDGNLNDGNPGAANFGNQTAQSWVIATAVGTTGFSADKFTVDTSAFANDLAGGSFSVATNGASLLLVFLPQPAPPVFGDIAFDGTNLILTGAGGVTGGRYFVLSSTNPASPLGEWPRVATNWFGPGGSFIFSNLPGRDAAQNFFRLQLP